ncbi:glutamate-rich protein 2 [Bombina bombina]|uniref:glutamate-rich protein 2 n=1 Tax=Bombina bombina TaxID=8345 RepID=UPI00235ABB68|nr:glutamate-rich protein 2 [Bombina bombina]
MNRKCNSKDSTFTIKSKVDEKNEKIQMLAPKEKLVIAPECSNSRVNIPSKGLTENGAPKKLQASIIPSKSLPANKGQNNHVKDKQVGSSGEDDSDDEAEGAPLELITEFLKSVMDEDFKVAQKLCQMILLYEPDNPEAKEFSPLIDQVLKLEAELSTESDDSEDSSEDSDVESSESNDSDTGDSDGTSDETSDEESED